jgi:AcrR family transcriptional regulator
MEIKHDTRTIRTRKHLAQSMLKLLQAHSLEEINIVDICNQAQVHRTTFYNHFNDKYELFSYLFDEIKNEVFDTAIEAHSENNSLEIYIQIAKNVLDFIDDNKQVFIQILQHNKNEIVIGVFNESLERAIKFLLNQNGQQLGLPIEILASFYTGGFSALALLWLNNPNKYTKEEFLTFFKRLITGKIEN